MTSRAATTQPSPTQWVYGILIVSTVLGLGFGSWLSRLPAVRDHVGATTLEMSIYGLCLATGSLVGLVFSGYMVSSLGPRKSIKICLTVHAVAMPIATMLIWNDLLVPGLAVLFCYGYVFSTTDVAMNVSGALAERALGKPRLPLIHAGFSLGSVSATGLGSLAEFFKVPVPIHLTVVFGVIIVVGLCALRLIPIDKHLAAQPQNSTDSLPVTHTGPIPITSLVHPEPAEAAHRRGRSPWRDPRVLIVGLLTLSMALAEGTAADWLPLALVDGRGIPNEVGTLILGLFFASMTVTRLTGSLILSRFGRVAVLRGGSLLCAAGVVVVILVPITWGIAVGAVCWGVGCALGFPVGISAAADNRETAVRDVAAVSAIAYTAMLLGPMAFGFLGERVGLLSAFWVLATIALLSAFLSGAAREPWRKTHAPTRDEA